MNMCSWHVVQEVIVKSKNRIVRVKDEIVTLSMNEKSLESNHARVGWDPSSQRKRAQRTPCTLSHVETNSRRRETGLATS